MADRIRVNGNIHSWGSITVKFDGDTYYGFNSITYADKRTRTKAYGMGAHHAPRGRSRGKYEIDPVKLGGPKETIDDLRAALAAKSADGISYGDVEFQIVVLYDETQSRTLIVNIDDCVITGNSSSEEENPDPLKEEIEIDAMRIRRNGRVLWDNSQGAP